MISNNEIPSWAKTINEILSRKELEWSECLKESLREMPKLLWVSALWAIPISIVMEAFVLVLAKTADPAAWSVTLKTAAKLSSEQWRAELPMFEGAFGVFFVLAFGLSITAGLKGGPRRHPKALIMLIAIGGPGLLVLGLNLPTDLFIAGFLTAVLTLVILSARSETRSCQSGN